MVRAVTRPRISAIKLRCRGSKCWTTTTGTGKSAGSVVKILVSACKPPAEVATATMLNADFTGRTALSPSLPGSPPVNSDHECTDPRKVDYCVLIRRLPQPPYLENRKLLPDGHVTRAIYTRKLNITRTDCGGKLLTNWARRP